MIFELSADRVGLNCWIESGCRPFMYMRENWNQVWNTEELHALEWPSVSRYCIKI